MNSGGRGQGVKRSHPSNTLTANKDEWANKYEKPLPKEIMEICTEFKCGLCDVPFTSEAVKANHYQGKPHAKKVDAALLEHSQKTGETLIKRAKVSVEKIAGDTWDIERLAHWQSSYIDTWESALPDELLKLVRPHRCEVCAMSFNNKIEGTQHINGKNHDKQVRNWLQDYCKTKGVEMPTKKKKEGDLSTNGQEVPTKKKKEGDASEKQETAAKKKEAYAPVNPEDRECSICNVSFTSAVIAESHYSGKKHRSKVNSTDSNSSTGTAPAGKKPTPPPPQGNFRCNLCNVAATDENGLQMHYEGKKHKSNEKKNAEAVSSSI